MRFRRRSWALVAGACLTTTALTGLAGASSSVSKGTLPAQTNGDVKTLLSREGAVVADLRAFQKLDKTAAVGAIAAKLKADERASSAAEAAVNKDLSGKSQTASSSAPGVGMTLTSNGTTVQLIAYGPDPGASNGFIRPKTGNSLVSATVQGCAPKSGRVSFNPLYFTLKMKDNTTANAALGEVDGQIDSSDQAPGSCIRGKIGFEVPPGETPATLIFQPYGFGQSLQWRVG